MVMCGLRRVWLCKGFEKNMVIRGLGVTWLSKGFGGRII